MISNSEAGSQLHLTVLSQNDVQSVHMASLEILERTGLFVESPLAREMLRGAGARVEGERVRIPAFVVDAALRTVPKRVTVCNRDGDRIMFLEGNRCYFTALADNYRILDPFTRSNRPFQSKDYAMTARVIDACPHLWSGCGLGNTSDYPATVGQQASFKYAMLNMKKPYTAHPLDAQQMADVFDMAAAIAGSYEKLRQAPFVIATAEPTTPLAIFKEAADILLLSARENMPIVWYPMPSAGTTSPSTSASTIATGNAEVLAGLVLHQLERPGAPFIYGSIPGTTDMRSTQWAYGSPNMAVQVAANTDLAHSYGLPFFGTAGCTDALAVDQQAAVETTMLCLMAQLSGANLVHDVGLMAGSTLLAPELMVLVDEIVDMLDQATRPISTDSEELALDLIDEVGPQGNYLALDHTLANFRRFWHSDIFLRNRLTGSPEDEPEPVAERINKKTIDIIENHQVEPLPDDVLKELDQLERKWMGRAKA